MINTATFLDTLGELIDASPILEIDQQYQLNTLTGAINLTGNCLDVISNTHTIYNVNIQNIPMLPYARTDQLISRTSKKIIVHQKK